MKKIKSLLITLMILACLIGTSGCSAEPVVSVIDGYVAVNGIKTEYPVDKPDKITVENDHLVVNGVKTEYIIDKPDIITVEDDHLVVNGVKTDYIIDKDDVITVEDDYLVVNGVKTDYVIDKPDVITVEDDYLVVNGVKTDYVIDKDDVIDIEDGYLVVNGVKTKHKIYTEPVVSVIDGYVAVNGVKTQYLVDKADVITVDGGYLVVNGVKTQHKIYTEPVVSVIDGYVAVNGVKTAYKVYVEPTENAAAARHAFVYDEKDGLVFLKGNMNEQIYPASITKLVTAMVVLENASLDTVFTVGDEISLVSAGASSAYLQKGQNWNVRKLLEGLLLPSGCDAAYTLAVNVGKIIDPEAADTTAAIAAFVGEMNAWTKRNGFVNSQFKNPDGFHIDGHYTCMQDILTLALLCQKNETVMSIVKIANISGWKNTNKLLQTSSPYYNADCIGFKTGSTNQAGNCLLSCFSKNGKFVIIGVFGVSTSNTRFAVTNNLYKAYGN